MFDHKEVKEDLETLSNFLSKEDFTALKILMEKIMKIEKPAVVSFKLLKFLFPTALIFLVLIIPFRGNNLLMRFGVGRQFIIIASIIIFTSFLITLFIFIACVGSLYKTRPQYEQLQGLGKKFVDVKDLPDDVLKEVSDEQIKKYEDFKLRLKE